MTIAKDRFYLEAHSIVSMATVGIVEQPKGRIVAIAVDDLTTERLKTAVRAAGHDLSVLWVRRAADVPDDPGVPTVFLVDWGADRAAEAAETCKAIRSTSQNDQRYILALSGVGERVSLMQALDTHADAILARPFGNDELMIKLRRAFQNMQSERSHHATVRAALHEGLTAGGGGEVVVRSESAVGNIHIKDGHIVWAHLSTAPTSMEEVLKHGGVVLEKDVLDAVKSECRASKAHFMEVIVRWGLVPQTQAREAVRRFVTHRLESILDLPNATALFLPKSQTYSAPLRFQPEELTSTPPPPPAPMTPISDSDRPAPVTVRSHEVPISVGPTSEEAAGFISSLMRMEGAIGAAVLDRKTGEFLAKKGEPLNTEVVWCLLGALVRMGREGAEAMAATGDQVMLARPLKATPSFILFVLASTGHVSLGLARSTLLQIATASVF